MSRVAIAQPPMLQRRPSAKARAEWRAARWFQRRAQLILAAERVPFVEWLLLETLKELTEEGTPYISQRAVAQRAGVTPGVTSYWMRMMEEYGLIDRGRDALPAHDVILTNGGEATLRRCNERLEAAGLTG